LFDNNIIWFVRFSAPYGLAARLSIRQIKASTKLSVGAIQKLLVEADALEHCQVSWSSECLCPPIAS
jgi:hypothetical protein